MDNTPNCHKQTESGSSNALNPKRGKFRKDLASRNDACSCSGNLQSLTKIMKAEGVLLDTRLAGRRLSLSSVSQIEPSMFGLYVWQVCDIRVRISFPFARASGSGIRVRA